MTMGRNEQGFSLIELLVVVAIISILAGIAYPMYSTYITEARRNDAKTAMMEIMQQQESYYSNNNTYTGDLSNLPQYSNATVESPKGYYQVTAGNCSGTSLTGCVLLTASPQGAQSADGNMTYNSRGQKTPQSHWE